MSELLFALKKAIETKGLPLDVLAAGSVSMSDDSVPEPDLSVIAPSYEEADTIIKEELKIAVEVSDSSAQFDMTRKAELYARHGIPEYWVIHREGRAVVQMWSPAEGAYGQRQEVKFGEPVEAATIEGLAVETGWLN